MIEQLAKAARPAGKVTVAIISIVVLLAGLWALPTWAGSMPPVQRIVLPNELVLLVSEEHSLPFVVFQLLVDAGSRRIRPARRALPTLRQRVCCSGRPDRMSLP